MRVIVAGGGVAGAAGAIALRRIGADVTVYESHADPAGTVGSFLGLAANGLRGLDTLGCLDRVRAAGFPVPRQRMWTGSGRLLGDLPRGRLEADPTHSVTLLRGRLVEELRAEAGAAGARIVTGERLVDAAPAADGVRAVFESGLAAEADLLVGADGIRSTVRRIIDPAAPEPAYAGCFTASGTASGVPVEPGTFNMTFARAGAFISIAAPGGDVWWAAQVTSPAEPDLDAIDLDGLLELYRDDAHPAAVLRAATSLDRPTPHHVLPPVRSWCGDRTVLTGDAAHPVGSGQGASMAIEDAAVLAHALASAPAVGDALARYERDRRARAAKLVKMASANRDAKAAGPLARRVQSLVMPVFFRFFFERATAWLYDHELEPLPAQAGTGR